MEEKKGINEMTVEELREKVKKLEEERNTYKNLYEFAQTEREKYENVITALKGVIKLA